MSKAAVFDVDGTLLDSMPVWENLGVRYLKRLGIEPEVELGKILFPMTIEEGAEYIKKRYGLSMECRKIIDEILEIVRDFYFYEVSLKKGAEEVLKVFEERGIPMAVATSGERLLVEAAFERLGIRRYFQVILTCTEVGAGKRSPLIYRKAAAALGAAPEETWVFEDALYAIKTAKAAGFRTVGVYDPSNRKAWKEISMEADVCAKTFVECPGLWIDTGRGTNK